MPQKSLFPQIKPKAAKVEPLEWNGLLRCCLWGRFGAGKTVCAATAPGPRRIYDTEQGLLSIRAVKDVDRIAAEEDGMITVMEDFAHVLDKGLDEEYETIIVDGLSTLQSATMGVILGDFDTPEQRDYLRISEWIRRFILMMKQAKCHLIFTAHERIDEGYATPGLSPACRDQMIAQMDLVARIVTAGDVGGKLLEKVGNPKTRLLLTDKHSRLGQVSPGDGKDRLGVLKAIEPNPNITEIIERLQKEYASGKEDKGK